MHHVVTLLLSVVGGVCSFFVNVLLIQLAIGNAGFMGLIYFLQHQLMKWRCIYSYGTTNRSTNYSNSFRIFLLKSNKNNKCQTVAIYITYYIMHFI